MENVMVARDAKAMSYEDVAYQLDSVDITSNDYVRLTGDTPIVMQITIDGNVIERSISSVECFTDETNNATVILKG